MIGRAQRVSRNPARSGRVVTGGFGARRGGEEPFYCNDSFHRMRGVY